MADTDLNEVGVVVVVAVVVGVGRPEASAAVDPDVLTAVTKLTLEWT